jgi:hypothetical protein
MATLAVSSRVESVVAAYGIFWQMWPQFEQIGGERCLAGLEVELIGSHPAEASHVDPSCPMCHHVRSVLLEIADLMTKGDVEGNSLAYYVDSHWNSILCLPALGNRSAVSVSINVSWNRAADQAFETNLQNNIKAFLNKYGIHQR